MNIREGDMVLTPSGVSPNAWSMEIAAERGYFERVGEKQWAVLARAKSTKSGCVMPANFLERRASNRLAARTPALLRPLLGYPDVWTLTERGRVCWLVMTR